MHRKQSHLGKNWCVCVPGIFPLRGYTKQNKCQIQIVFTVNCSTKTLIIYFQLCSCVYMKLHEWKSACEARRSLTLAICSGCCCCDRSRTAKSRKNCDQFVTNFASSVWLWLSGLSLWPNQWLPRFHVAS